MKYFILFLGLSCTFIQSVSAANTFSNDQITDTIKAVSFIASINVQSVTSKKEVFAGIKTDLVKLSLEADKNDHEVVFEFPKGATVFTKGSDVEADEAGEMEWNYNWSVGETYKLLLATAPDSAGNFTLYSGYIFLPKENKWKLIGTCKINGKWKYIEKPSAFVTSNQSKLQVKITDEWLQRSNGYWKNLRDTSTINPVINLFSHVDSLYQFNIDQKIIEQQLAAGIIDTKQNSEGVYYKILQQGSGKKVMVDDTVTVFYRLTLLNDTATVDATKDKPATFPLSRLIKGWQIGVPLLNVGGKIKLVIPSALAYSIRTRSPKIPPNSILVFDIEVVDAKAPQ